MNRWFLIGSLAALLISSSGCLRHGVRGGGHHCGHAGCGGGETLGRPGLGGRLAGRLAGHGHCGPDGCSHGGCGRQGCVAGKLGWQQGGLDYSSHLNPGVLGHRAGAQLQGQPFTPGPPTGQVGYPYYSHRGPRDFLMDNPPSIGR